MTDEPARFPITLWPSVPLSAVVVAREPVLLGNDGVLCWRGPHPERPPVELPDEWVLRDLARCNLDDDKAVMKILKTGIITSPYFDPASVPPDRRGRLAPLMGGDSWRTRHDARLEDARWWLKTARALARIWAQTSAGGHSRGVWADEGFVGLGFGTRRADTDDHWMQFVLALDIGLETFRAHASYDVTVGSGKVEFGAPRVGLYSAACRQVFNFVVRDSHARTCQNETCRTSFVLQIGGAKHEQHRTKGEIKYCSPECAHQQRSREHRRRQKYNQKGKR